MKYVLTLKESSNVPVTCELEGNKIMCNDLCLSRYIDADVSSFNASKPYVIGHEFGAVCLVWATCEQDALDNAVDANMLDSLMAEEQDYDNEELTPLGNALELFDLTNVWMGEVELDPARDIKLIVKLVRANEAGQDVIEE